MKWLLIAMGGGLGSVLRYGTSSMVQHLGRGTIFPIGTAAVNVLGCFLIGLLSGLASSRELLSAEARFFLMVGFLGGFTTFSTFGADTVNLIRSNAFFPALVNASGQVILGVAAVMAGLWLGSR